MKIRHESRFTDVELFAMFNVELNSSRQGRRGAIQTAIGDIQTPLLVWKKVKLPKRFNTAIGDNVKAGVTIHPPGSKERVADLAAFYQDNAGDELSAFE